LDPDVAQSPFLQPFVLAIPEARRRREGIIDVYMPLGRERLPRPAIVFVHGGPLPPDLQPKPRDWPVFTGYGSFAASRGMVGVTVDHRLHSLADHSTAADDVASAVAQARALEEVNSDRVALWFFSGGGLLSADWLAQPPPWLRCIAATYPLLAPLPGWDVDTRFRPVEAVRTAGSVPILLTRVGREHPEIAATVEAFTASAELHEVAIDVIDVPDGQHSFDILDHTDSSRAAVTEAMTRVTAALTHEPLS
jgi:acetyl esterase/lipase